MEIIEVVMSAKIGMYFALEKGTIYTNKAASKGIERRVKI